MAAEITLTFERQHRPISDARWKQLLQDSHRALQLADNESDGAKAHYVHGLGWLRRHLDSRQEQPLVAGHFQQAADRAWQNTDLQAAVVELQRQFQAQAGEAP